MKQTKELRAWARAVKDRDFNKCVICGKEAGKGKGHGLNAHHIIPKELRATRLDVGNGISLCPLHHRFSFKFSAHQNPFAFFRWLFLERNAQYMHCAVKLEEMEDD